jgi:hypothetical protein
MVCMKVEEEKSNGFFLYYEGKPKVRWEIEEPGELVSINPEASGAVFSPDGEYLLLMGGTGSAGRDIAIHRHVKGLKYRLVRDTAVSMPIQNLAFPHNPKDGTLDHSYVDFAGWVQPHVMRVLLSGRGSLGVGVRVAVGDWESLFDLDKLKALPSPKAKNAGKLERVRSED